MSAELDYFGNAHVSKLVDLVLQLTTEVHVVTQRVHALEMQLVRAGSLDPGQLDAFVPGDAERQVLDARRDELMDRLLRIITEAGPAEHPLREQWAAALERKAGG
jgi:hypothetical protein